MICVVVVAAAKRVMCATNDGLEIISVFSRYVEVFGHRKEEEKKIKSRQIEKEKVEYHQESQKGIIIWFSLYFVFHQCCVVTEEGKKVDWTTRAETMMSTVDYCIVLMLVSIWGVMKFVDVLNIRRGRKEMSSQQMKKKRNNVVESSLINF